MKMNDSKGFQHFNVPNTPEGQAFMSQLRKYVNRHAFGVRCRGRGNRPSRRYQAHLPMPMSKWFAVYLQLTEETGKMIRERELEQHKKAVATLERKLAEVTKERDIFRQNMSAIASERNDLLTECQILQEKQEKQEKEQVLSVKGGKGVTIKISVE